MRFVSSKSFVLASLLALLSLSFAFAGEKAQAPPPTSADILKPVKVEKGFEVNVFASPPNVGYPVCISAAPTGELFVGVDENGSLDRAPDRGRIVRCVDTKGDGVADKFTVFCKVDSPRGLFFDDNMLIIQHPPLIEAYFDDNGTGVANRHETLVTGLGFGLDSRGADHTTNGIRYGIDGWIYIAMGDYGSPNAVGKDGTKLKHRGGGIVRVRPDGTELEMYVVGTRNICGVAVDPLMNVYTVDNTNDGDGWWVRLAHDVQSGNYGYPMFYMNFADELIPPLADYGGGSPTGILYLHEPGFAKEYGDALYACEWGHGKIVRHPLIPTGASFKAPQQKAEEWLSFLSVERPTDFDVDGQSRLYAASWKGATFTYNGPNAGFILRVTDPKVKQPPFPNLKTASDDDLIKYMGSPSHVYHVHTQREILRRGVKPVFTAGLEKLAAEDKDLTVRVAAIYTLKQLLGEKAIDTLVKLSKIDELREHCLRALTDRKKECAGLDLKIFTDALNDKNPRVHLQALISLGRIGKVEAGEAMIPSIGDADPLTAHIAINNMVELKASAAAFKALDSGDAKLRNGAVRVLYGLHQNDVVDGLIQRIDKTGDSYQKQAVLKGLCRLYNVEKEWEATIKQWWGTRPDTTGPYYSPVTWEKSADIAKALQGVLAGTDTATIRWLLPEMVRNRIELPEIVPALLKIAKDDPSYAVTAAAVFLGKKTLPNEAIGIVGEVVTNANETPALRAKAMRALIKVIGAPGAIESLEKAFSAMDKTANKELLSARDEFIREPKCAQQIPYFAKVAASGTPGERELAYAVLIHIHGAQKTSKEHKAASEKAIDAGFASAESAPALFHAIASARADQYAAKIREASASTTAAIADAAKATLKEMKLDAPKNTEKKVAIGTMLAEGDGAKYDEKKYETLLAGALKDKGDRDLGEQLFKKQNCIACHTVSKSEPPKGPYLGDIANRYKRPDLIESILKPSAKITQGFETNKYKMKDGKRLEGFIVKKGDDEIEIRMNPTDQVVLQTKDIETVTEHKNFSIMPDDLLKEQSVHDLSSILAYLEWLNEQTKK